LNPSFPQGIIGNTFWDPVWDEYFDYFNYMQTDGTHRFTHSDSKWYTGQPIWQVKQINIDFLN
jgi:hypothetical protein